MNASLLNKGVGVPRTKRVLDLIDLCAIHRCKKARFTQKEANEALKDTILDYSQSHSRRPFSNSDGVARSLTTSSSLYSYRLDRELHPVEHLYLQGFPMPGADGSIGVRIPENMPPTEVKKMAGEGIALPCLAMVIWALFLTQGFP